MRKVKRQAKSNTSPIPVPVRGWYSNESVANAPPQTAIILDNCFCEADSVRIRRGHTSHSDTSSASLVETLMAYHSGTTSVLFGASGSAIYDVTAGNPSSADVTGLSNNRWQHTNIATSGGQFLICVNGEDSPRNYNGSAWATTPAITGPSDITKLIDVWQYQNQLWFIEDGSTTAYHLAVDAIGGAATSLACGGYLKKGGKLLAGETWSSDAGDGYDDRLVLVSDQGEALIFVGANPAASNWNMVGRYDIGKPIGRRCLFRIGGDLLVITDEAVLPVSQIVQIDSAVTRKVAFTGPINSDYVQAAKLNKSHYGWQLISYPAANMAILNVPGAGNENTEQFVMNVLTGAWSRFTNMNAICWAEFDGKLYFGGTDGVVYQAESGANDNGASIEAYMLPAYSHLGFPGRHKYVTQIRPYISSNVDVAPEIGIAADFETPNQTFETVSIGTTFFTWDVSVWDGPDVWGGSVVYKNWRTGGGIGTYVSPAVYIGVDASDTADDLDFRFLSFDAVFEVGHVNG